MVVARADQAAKMVVEVFVSDVPATTDH